MEHQGQAIKGKLNIIPSPNSSKNDFDFLTGKWSIRNRKLKTRLSRCAEWSEFEAEQEMYKILNGLGNTDFFKTGKGDKRFEGMTLRLFNPQTKLWSIYWADSDKGKLDVPVIGSFENSIGRFYAEDVFNGKDILVKFLWDASNPDEPVWSQAFSDDNGKTWEWNWYMYMTRVK